MSMGTDTKRVEGEGRKEKEKNKRTISCFAFTLAFC